MVICPICQTSKYIILVRVYFIRGNKWRQEKCTNPDCSYLFKAWVAETGKCEGMDIVGCPIWIRKVY